MALWTPNALPNLKYGLIGSAPGNTLVSGELSVAADTSGNGFPATAALAANYGLLSTTLNGLAVISGNASTKKAAFELLSAQGMSNNVSGMSSFLVNRTASVTVTDNPIVHFSRNGASNTRYTLSRGSGSAGDVTLGVRRLDSDGFTSISTGANHGTGWLFISAQSDYVAGAGQIWVNGTSAVSGALGSGGGNTSATNSQIAALGEYDNGAGGAWQHDEAEIWHIIGILTTADRQRMEGYLAWKYGLQANLPVGHPYLAAAPTLADNAATESSAGTESTNRTVAIASAASESSAGTDASNRTIALPRAVTETTAGTDGANRTLALSTGVGETSTGTDSSSQTGGASGGTSDQAETSAGTTAQDYTISQIWGVSESSAGTDSANRSIATITRSVAESSVGDTTQTGTTPQPVGSGSNGLRRWVIQQYESYFAKRDKEKALKEVAKEIETLSGGVVSAQSVIKKERPPKPIVALTPDAESVRLVRARQAAMRDLDRAQQEFMARQAMLAQGVQMSVDLDRHLQRLESEQADEDLLLLASVL